jgi:DMSO/TMAO reductase YedYZ molybdopterin-dependent catalytic subunit
VGYKDYGFLENMRLSALRCVEYWNSLVKERWQGTRLGTVDVNVR